MSECWCNIFVSNCNCSTLHTFPLLASIRFGAVELLSKTESPAPRPQGNVNAGGSPCRRRSRCSACSCLKCYVRVAQGIALTKGDRSSAGTGKGRSGALGLGPRPSSSLSKHETGHRLCPLEFPGASE